MSPVTVRASLWAMVFTAVLALLIVVGSRNLAHFDAALVGYTFATLFATFGITYRYALGASAACLGLNLGLLRYLFKR